MLLEAEVHCSESFFYEHPLYFEGAFQYKQVLMVEQIEFFVGHKGYVQSMGMLLQGEYLFSHMEDWNHPYYFEA
ncbi:hypothetical protein ccbrp13_21620 [Ktedonobacteria bacterium brp13]|nr:hypothetical protein ccbrp13_21620 [Ktedonobacteria bacterium brp13]